MAMHYPVDGHFYRRLLRDPGKYFGTYERPHMEYCVVYPRLLERHVASGSSSPQHWVIPPELAFEGGQSWAGTDELDYLDPARIFGAIGRTPQETAYLIREAIWQAFQAPFPLRARCPKTGFLIGGQERFLSEIKECGTWRQWELMDHTVYGAEEGVLPVNSSYLEELLSRHPAPILYDMEADDERRPETQFERIAKRMFPKHGLVFATTRLSQYLQNELGVEVQTPAPKTVAPGVLEQLLRLAEAKGISLHSTDIDPRSTKEIIEAHVQVVNFERAFMEQAPSVMDIFKAVEGKASNFLPLDTEDKKLELKKYPKKKTTEEAELEEERFWSGRDLESE